jgi:GNAT superfamily N-acetyltransferase
MAEVSVYIVRPASLADAGDIARVHVASWRETYRGMLPDALLDGLNESSRAAYWLRTLGASDPQPVYVAASATGEIVGFASAGPEREGDERYTAELYTLYALRAAHGHGLGRALMAACAGALLNDGHKAMLLWVLAENPTRGFYEKLGGQVIDTKIETIGGASVTEVAYAWDDLTLLLQGPLP